LGKLREAMEGKIEDNIWLQASREFTRQLEALGRIMEALDLPVDLQDYPRLRNQVDYKPRQRGSQELEHAERIRSRREEEPPRRKEEEEQPVDRDGEELQEADHKHFPKSPANQRHATSTGATGWEAIDRLTVTQCARMPIGMHTTEFIPNSLQEECTEAWNTSHEIRKERDNGGGKGPIEHRSRFYG
jgi:hypothetical protein